MPFCKSTNKKALRWAKLLKKEAATYSPIFADSTIGAEGLNFSVRNGKRWNTLAITTIIFWCILNTYFFISLTRKRDLLTSSNLLVYLLKKRKLSGN